MVRHDLQAGPEELAVDTVSRVPFTPEESKAIQEARAEDDFIRPVIITAMCTAMRRGDCCCLKWEDVDLREGFISVKTSKTGQKVSWPLGKLGDPFRVLTCARDRGELSREPVRDASEPVGQG